MIRILMADDHPVVRKGLVTILGSEPSFAIVGEAGNAGEVLALLQSSAVDVLLMDISMPGTSGLELLPELKRHYPRLPVLILSQYPESQMAVRAIRSGAQGYLNKDSAPAELVQAVKRVYEGKKYVTDSVLDLLAETVQKPGENPHESLSNRKFRVFCLLASGKTVSDIGELLNLSAKTISTYRTRVLDKLSLRTNADLARYAIDHGIPE